MAIDRTTAFGKSHVENLQTQHPILLAPKTPSGSNIGLKKMLARVCPKYWRFPMIFGAVIATLFFSVFFAVLLIPLGIIGFKAWRMMNRMKRQSLRETEAESLSAEYTVVSDQDKT